MRVAERRPVVTRFFWPPLMPRTMSLPTSVSWHTCTSYEHENRYIFPSRFGADQMNRSM